MFNDPTFWVAMAFIAFIGVLVYFKVPGLVTSALDKRADKIKSISLVKGNDTSAPIIMGVTIETHKSKKKH